MRAVGGVGLLVAAAGPLWSSAVVDAGAAPVTYYLSLGDSLAQGYQPIGGPPSGSGLVGYNQGYADQLFKLARTRQLGSSPTRQVGLWR